jgi:hypothetical protein
VPPWTHDSTMSIAYSTGSCSYTDKAVNNVREAREKFRHGALAGKVRPGRALT